MGWTHANFCDEAFVQPFKRSTAPAALACATKNYPVTGIGRELCDSGQGPGAWQWWWFNGDILLAVNEQNSRVVDVTKEVARLSGSSARAAIYRPAIGGDKLLIPSDRGLWMLDSAGAITRADLGANNRSGTTVVMNWPTKTGKLYIGLAPQCGGQVFEYDLATGTFTLTRYFCALGADESCFVALDRTPSMLYMVEAMRLKANSQPASSRPSPSSRPAASTSAPAN